MQHWLQQCVATVLVCKWSEETVLQASPQQSYRILSDLGYMELHFTMVVQDLGLVARGGLSINPIGYDEG